MPVNFRCADIICDFCGYLAQVKATERADVGTLPPDRSWELHGGRKTSAWTAGIYFPLFIVVANLDRSAHAVYYLPADLQQPEMFQQRDLFGRRRVERDGSATCCGSTCLEVTGQYG